MSKQSELKGIAPAKTKAQLRAAELLDEMDVMADKRENLNRRKASLMSQMREDGVKEVKIRADGGKLHTWILDETAKLKHSVEKAQPEKVKVGQDG